MNDKEKKEKMIFNAILASAVHDMKNSLGMLLNTVEEMALEHLSEYPKEAERFSYLQYQASRVNNDLVTLLSLYKIDQNQYPFNIEELDVEEFLEEQMVRYSTIAERKGIEIELDCPDDLWWCFDANLVSGAINDTLGNAIRYCKDKIILKAQEEGGMLRISVEDDGDGYPKTILESNLDEAKETSFKTGGTGLGIFFSHLIADMHQHNGQKGRVELDNSSSVGGGRFSIMLPK